MWCGCAPPSCLEVDCAVRRPTTGSARCIHSSGQERSKAKELFRDPPKPILTGDLVLRTARRPLALPSRVGCAGHPIQVPRHVLLGPPPRLLASGPLEPRIWPPPAAATSASHTPETSSALLVKPGLVGQLPCRTMVRKPSRCSDRSAPPKSESPEMMTTSHSAASWRCCRTACSDHGGVPT